MAKIKSLEYPKPKTSLYLCCFGLVHRKTTPTDHSIITGSEHKCRSNNCFPWQRIKLGVKNSMAKTVPLEGSNFDDIENLKLKGTVNKVHLPRWRWKWKSKSKSKSDFLINTQSNSTSSNSKFQQNQGNNVKSNRREQNMSTIKKTTSLPTCSKRQERRLLWSTHYETTWKHAKRKQTQNAERHNLVTVAWLVVIILVSMMVWGRLWSIICTSLCFYLIPCFTTTPQNDKQSDSNDLVLDFKRKPIQRCSTSL